MTDSMNFGPDWIRNLSSEGTTTGNSGGVKYQLADYRYGREEMLALFDRNLKPPQSLVGFKALYSEVTLPPLALSPNVDEEQRGWQQRPISLSGPPRGRGGPLERGGRVSRGARGGYQNYGRPQTTYDGGWGAGGVEQTEWSPRKDYNMRGGGNDNWRRNRLNNEGDDDGWRNLNHGRPNQEKWGRSTSWRGGDSELEDRAERQGGGGQEGRMNRSSWNDNVRMRKSWENEDHLPEWAMENVDGGGTFDASGAFHNSDDEQEEGRSHTKKETVLQKSSSQQHITQNKGYFSSLQTSKSVASLSKSQQENHTFNMKERGLENEKELRTRQDQEDMDRQQSKKRSDDEELSGKEKNKESYPGENRKNGSPPEMKSNKKDNLRVEDDYKIQEDIILKLVDEDTPNKSRSDQQNNSLEGGVPSVLQPPPNLVPTVMQQQQQQPPDQWFYQDPQGQMQGPFTSAEMAEWYKAGYFNGQLKLRRPCDELFYHLGELLALSEGANPFSSGKRFPPLKPDANAAAAAALPEHDLLQYQYLMALKQAQSRALAAAVNMPPEPWNAAAAVALQQQQQEAQRLIMHQQQVPQDLQFMHQSNTSNPLMHMINQMQQANKLPDKTPPNSLPSQLDPRLVLSNLQQTLQQQNRGGLVPNVAAPGVAPNTANSSVASSRTDAPVGYGLPPVGAFHHGGVLGNGRGGGGMAPGFGAALNLPRPLSAHNTSAVDNLVPKQAEDPISSLLKQLQQQQQQQQATGVSLDSLWQNTQFPQTLPAQQWQPTQPQQQQENPSPLTMWDIPKTAEIAAREPSASTHHHPPPPPLVAATALSSPKQDHPQPMPITSPAERRDCLPPPPTSSSSNNTNRQDVPSTTKKDEQVASAKEMKKRKELEEKQAKKEVEERRKNEQRKMETEKRAAEERKKKEEEKVKKEMEKAKKEAEDKRMRELEEKRRLKELRKLEEEQKKRTEEQKKADDERAKKEAKEREDYARREAARVAQEQAARNSKIAPWSRSASTQGLSLHEIQKLEKERARQEAAQEQQRQRLAQELLAQQQREQEKAGGFTWANKTKESTKGHQQQQRIGVVPNQVEVKSLAEIQAEEQERLAKQTAEARLIALQKEKEQPQMQTSAGNIWNSQNLTWSNANSSSNASWSSNISSGLWDETPSKPITKQQLPISIAKSGNNASSATTGKQQQKQQKSKNKKDDSKNTNSSDDFTGWCCKTLANMNSEIDIPTFVTFLRDIESALDVREYCVEYLGDSQQTSQFAANFLEKRRSFRPKTNQPPKDDMCMPAPAITPSSNHNNNNNDFQEVKGKNKKNKKNKMLKVDNRILGFNVTSAPDRINVGDRDYGDNS